MGVLRAITNSWPCLLIASCGFLLASTYIIHANIVFNNIRKTKLSSITYPYNIDRDTELLKTTNKNNQSEFMATRLPNIEKFNSYEVMSLQSDSTLSLLTVQDGRNNGFLRDEKPHEQGQGITYSINKNDVLNTQEEIQKDNGDIHFKANHDMEMLNNIFVDKINAVNMNKKNYFKPTCESDFKLGNSCDNNKCFQKELPEDLMTRVKQLVTPQQLQMSQEQHNILQEMADESNSSYDIILLTAGSSNHFLESQALLKNLHENVYPYLKNFTLIFYNLGLTEQEQILMVKFCKCQVLDFPFHKFPYFMRRLRCYSWKPVMIKAQLLKGNVVFWFDASIRFHNSPRDLHELIQATKERGVQIGGSGTESAFQTYRSMYHFFGDEPCAYLNLGLSKATYGVYHREYFVDRAILEPWVACAINEDCMCPKTNISATSENIRRSDRQWCQAVNINVYGLCHRYDQSAITLILHKLYQELNGWVMVRNEPVLTIKRGHKESYFPVV